jgi:hypothetical protein
LDGNDKAPSFTSSSNILRRVAKSIEPFGFEVVLRRPPPVLKGERNRSWQQAGLFGQVDDCQKHKLECIHNSDLPV